ncbi:fluoride efflux transporter CrcB [Noviherbaspirillum sp. UKPF54]|uniref:fluoride efflux transporter CrcB n=1 Tax=Noviherbaspirillum sp. UKPF54 TaxID=2601898 RepID=UPI0011B1A59A|nr:fluoride efflux transporter CrcB [Noviherbaspirillum sp. UKPF54]QDZ27442.1 fluoride efflux transporter CrcB [Noviherbaspirillum sp. UKPF54]
MSWLAVGLGAAIGAWLRWGLGSLLNNLHAHVLLGTLTANLGGGYLIGIAVGFFTAHPTVPLEWRLFAVTGFLGGLTTFSSFSAESMVLLQRGNYGWALAHSALHLLGSITCCIAGFASYRAISGS